MSILRARILFFGLLFLSAGVHSAETNKLIYYYTGCKNTEVYSDIEVSISGLADFAKKNGIQLIEVTKPHSCGYLLVDGKKNKYIKSALTNIDLEDISKIFFNL